MVYSSFDGAVTPTSYDRLNRTRKSTITRQYGKPFNFASGDDWLNEDSISYIINEVLLLLCKIQLVKDEILDAYIFF